MSADDFQTKYASVMESMLRSAVAETTKLFETMVDELKAEISKIKKENEDLKTRCSLFEKARGQTPSYTRETEADPRGNQPGSEKRDTAVQCDLVPLPVMVVEQCEPLRSSSLQNQEHQGDDSVRYVWQEHNYEMRAVKRSHGAIGVKKEGSAQSPQQSVSSSSSDLRRKHSQQVSCNTTGLPRTSTSAIQNKRLSNNQPVSSAETPLPEETQVGQEMTCLRNNSSSLEIKNNASELESDVNGDVEVDSEVRPKISEIWSEGETATSENQPVAVVQQKSDGKMSEQTNVDLEQLALVQSTDKQFSKLTTASKKQDVDKLQSGVSERMATCQPDSPVRRRRGRPPKKQKRLQQPAQQIPLPSSEASAEKEVKDSPPTVVKETEVSSAYEAVNITSSKASKGSAIQPQDSSSIIALVQARENTALEKNSEVGSRTFSESPVSSICSQEKEKITSHQLSHNTEDRTIQTPTTKFSYTMEASNTPTTGFLEALSLSRERRTSVTLQDALLLVEAMNRSTEVNALCSPERTAAKSQIQCVPCVKTLKTVVEVPNEPSTAQVCVGVQEAPGSAQLTHVSKKTQLTKEELSVDIQATNATSDEEALAQKRVVTCKQQHIVALSNTAKSSIPTSTAATQTTVLSLKKHPVKSVAHMKQGHIVPHKIIVMSRSLASSMPCHLPTKSLTQPSSMVSTAAFPTEKSEVPSWTPTGPPLRSGTPTQQKITIIIPRQQSMMASQKHTQESAKSPYAVFSSSLESCVSDADTTVDNMATVSSIKQSNYPDNLDFPSEKASFSESKDTASPSLTSLGLAPTSISLAEKQKLSAVVRLTRLPFPMSTEEAVSLSSVPTNALPETQSILKESTSVEKQAPVVIPNPRSEMQALSSDISSMSKEKLVAENASKMSEKQEKASSTSEDEKVVDESTNSEHVQPFTLSESSAQIFENSTIETTKHSAAAFGIASSKTSPELEEKMSIMHCVLPRGPPVEQQSAAIINLMSMETKETFQPHAHMTKAQFLAKLAVSPVVQDSKKTFTNDSINSCAETAASDEKRLKSDTLVAKLRSHLKTHMQARTDRKQDTCTGKESLCVTPKKRRLEELTPEAKSTTFEPLTLSPRDGVDVLSLKIDTDDPSAISTRTFCNSAESGRSVSEPATLNSRQVKACLESSLSLRRSSSGKDGLRSESNKKSTSVSANRSKSAKENGSPQMAKSTSVSSRMSSSIKKRASPKKIKTVSSRRISSLTVSAIPKSAGCPENTETPKKKNSTSVGHRESSFNRNGPNPKMATNLLTPLSRRQLTFSKERSSTKSRKRELEVGCSSNCGTTADGSSTTRKSGTNHQTPKPAGSVGSSKSDLSNDDAKPNLLQDVSGANKNLREVNPRKLTKTSHFADNRSNCETVKKCSAKAVWTPPAPATNKTPPTGKKRSPHSFVKQESKSQNQSPQLVYPPSVTLHPIPVKAPPVVSPLQPLSVIGWRLLKNQCGECGRVLSSSAALESHVSLHTGHRPFSCKLCGKSFPDSKGLKRHGRVHRNGRIHICPQCGKGFVYSFGLTKHLQIVHSRIKPFVCQVCNKGFFAKRDVEAHIRIHTGEKPFHCNLCEKKFARRTELNMHLRWHNGEKRHWCPYCGKGFLDINNLKRHKYTHTGEKPHSCPHCPKHFTQSGHLKKHVKNVHKIQ